MLPSPGPEEENELDELLASLSGGQKHVLQPRKKGTFTMKVDISQTVQELEQLIQDQTTWVAQYRSRVNDIDLEMSRLSKQRLRLQSHIREMGQKSQEAQTHLRILRERQNQIVCKTCWWGGKDHLVYFPCESVTYRQLKFLHKKYWEGVYANARYVRWINKDEHNRRGPEPQRLQYRDLLWKVRADFLKCKPVGDLAQIRFLELSPEKIQELYILFGGRKYFIR